MLHKWQSATVRPCSNVRVILLDYRKAFDMVCHNLLVAKQCDFHIRETRINWKSNFYVSDSEEWKFWKILIMLHELRSKYMGYKWYGLPFLGSCPRLNAPEPEKKSNNTLVTWQPSPKNSTGPFVPHRLFSSCSRKRSQVSVFVVFRALRVFYLFLIQGIVTNGFQLKHVWFLCSEMSPFLPPGRIWET